jgi:hypothetical protein
MSNYDMVAFIVLVVMVASVIKAWLKSRSRAAAPADDARLLRLEERVKALEAVVGDSSFELKQKLRELEK